MYSLDLPRDASEMKPESDGPADSGLVICTSSVEGRLECGLSRDRIGSGTSTVWSVAERCDMKVDFAAFDKGHWLPVSVVS